MNSVYLNEYIDSFEKILSVAYQNDYSLDAVARAISYSSYFQKIENNNGEFAPIIDDTLLIKSIFPKLDIELNDLVVYKQCLWAAESYLRIQESTGLTFEAIFLYIPINEMYHYFVLYHEMDFSQIIERFKELQKDKSVFALLLKKYNYSLTYISQQTNISSETLFSLKNRRRDIKKVNVDTIVSIANLLRVRVETLAEIKMMP